MIDRILDDIVEAWKDGHMELAPSKLSQMSVEEILAETKYMNRQERKAWMNKAGNIRGIRAPSRSSGLTGLSSRITNTP